MRTAFLTAAAAAAMLISSTAASAAPVPPTIRHYAWPKMTLTQRIAAQRQLVVDDWRIITTWRVRQLELLHKQRALATSPPQWSAVSAMLPAEPYTVHWHYLHMKWTQRELAKSLHLLHLQRVRSTTYAPAGYPPHHALWQCISGFEGGDTSVNPNGHYGKLQMSLHWMNVVPGSGRASDFSDAQQEWFAETAWKANHYSYSFLYGQWYAYDNADGCGTTG